MADCPNLATAGDIQNIMAAIAQLSAKIPDDLATSTHIAGLESQIAQLSKRVEDLEIELKDSKTELSIVKAEMQFSAGAIANIPNWLDGLWGKISEFFGQIGSAISNSAQFVWDKVSEGVGFIAGKVGDVFNWVGDRAQWVWDKVTDSAGFVAGKVGDVANWVGDRSQWLWDKITDSTGFLAIKIGENANILGSLWDWTREKFGEIWAAITDVDEEFIAAQKRLLDAVRERIVEPIKSAISGFVSSIMDGIRSIWNAYANETREQLNFWGDLINRIKDGVSAILRAAQGTTNEDVLQKVEEVNQKIGQFPFTCLSYTPVLDNAYSNISEVLYSLTCGQSGTGGGTGSGTTCQFSSTEAQNISVDLDDIREKLDRLSDWVLGGVPADNDLSLNPENEIRAMVDKIFVTDLTFGKAKQISSLKEMLLAIAAVSYGRAGFQDYPINVPALPLDSGDPSLQIVTASRFQTWQTKFIDNGIGAFPFEIKVKDSDLIRVGDQGLDLKFPNIAETLAEIFGMLINIKAVGELSDELGQKALIEIASLRKQGFINYRLNEAIADYLGFKTKQKKEKIQLSFNPLVGRDGTTDSVSEALKPKEIEIIVETEDEKHSFEEKLATLLEAAAIIKAVHFEKFTENDIESTKEFYKSMVDEGEEQQQDFDTFIEEFEQGFIGRANINDQLNPYGRDFNRRPKVREIGEQVE